MASEETNAPRHGRHSAVGRHAAPRTDERAVAAEETQTGAVSAAPEPVAPEPARTVVPEPVVPASVSAETPMPVVPIMDGDQETSMGDAPRPIDVDPEETGSFKRISATEGARLTTRENASETNSFRTQAARPIEAVRMSSVGRPKVEHREVEVQSNKRVFLVLGIGALAVMAIVMTLLARAFSSVEEVHEKPVYEQVQANGEEGIEYRGTTYRISEESAGKYSLVSTSEGSEGTAIVCELEGTPVTLILYNTVFIIPENLADNTWDLIAHPLGGGSVTQQVTDADGNPIVGQGQISEAALSGDEILITTDSGEQFSVSLV